MTKQAPITQAKLFAYYVAAGPLRCIRPSWLSLGKFSRVTVNSNAFTLVAFSLPRTGLSRSAGLLRIYLREGWGGGVKACSALRWPT